MPSAATADPAADAALALLAGTARRLVLTGHTRSAASPQGCAAVQRPKEILLALAAALAAAEGLPVERANPHFAPLAAARDTDLAVAHFGPLELSCPLPRARNVLLLDGEDLLLLAEEWRSEDRFGLHRRRALLMDAILSLAPPAAMGELLPGERVRPAPLVALLAAAEGLARQPGGSPPGPVQWMECDLETGNYNFLQLRRTPKLGTRHARVLLDPGLRKGRAALLAFATPGTLADLGPALRAFAALRAGAPAAQGPLFFVLFFGTPEEFGSALAMRPDAPFFGDNFRCTGIRFLFAPFAAADLLAAIRGSTATVDSCHGGVLEALARSLGVPNRVVLGPDGSFEAAAGGRVAAARGIEWERVLRPETLVRRRQKANRAGERALATLLEAMLAPA